MNDLRQDVVEGFLVAIVLVASIGTAVLVIAALAGAFS